MITEYFGAISPRHKLEVTVIDGQQWLMKMGGARLRSPGWRTEVGWIKSSVLYEKS